MPRLNRRWAGRGRAVPLRARILMLVVVSVVPVIGVYPAFVALLAVAFLSERLSAMQAAGVLLAVTGVILVGAGS